MDDILEMKLKELAKTRPEMACIFQVIESKYERFTVYRVYILCYALNYIAKYRTTDLLDDLIILNKDDTDLNQKLKESGYDPEENVIYSFYLENQ